MKHRDNRIKTIQMVLEHHTMRYELTDKWSALNVLRIDESALIVAGHEIET